ncbi:BrnA antitoxin family protein [Sphingobium yanoikuyae]|uniref:BrnA antitoxin family protein n=1 Tax=Sphingobium yanoikuyae TaxID=13690 RepID=UPI0028AF75AD|nr:BrnA antitoxin family protein [Sphingobium yanoikuyae]
MTDPKHAAPEYTQADMDAASNNREWTADDFARAKPFAEAFPDLAKTIRVRGPQRTPKKVSTLCLSPEVIEHFKSGGPGWQSRIDAALKEWVAAH